MAKPIHELQRTNAILKAECKAIVDKAAAEGKDMSTGESAAVDAMLDRIDSNNREIEKANGAAAKALRGEGTTGGSLSSELRGNAGNAGNAGQWITRDGAPVTVLAKGQPLVSGGSIGGYNADSDGPLSIGNFVRSIVTGNKKYAEREHLILNAVDLGGSAATGGVMVPSQMFGSVIDASRAQAVVMQAGAMTIPMETASMSIARVKTDPTFETKEQNAEFTGSTIVFDAINLNARTIGTVITMSAEMAADAPNAGQLIDQVLAQALAAEIDRLALQGQAGQPTGIINMAGTGETTSVGAIAWEDYAAAVEALELLNANPNAYILNPAIKKDLSLLTTGDGTNSAKNWLPAPDGVAQLQRFSTTNCPLASSIIGDFTKLMFGVRESAQIQVSPFAGDAFTKNQIKVRIVWRGDVVAVRPNHFHILRGITS